MCSVQICAHVCTSQKRTVGVVLYCALFYFLEVGLSLNRRLAILSSQQSLGTCLSVAGY